MAALINATGKQARALKLDMFYSSAECSKCKMFLRVKLKADHYICPCRIKYRGATKRASPI